MTNCTLEPWQDAHDAATVRWLNDPALRASFGITSAVTLESHRRWRTAAPSLTAWALRDAGGHHVGNLLLQRNDAHRSAYLQIYVGEPKAQGQGLGTSAMRLALTQAFGPLQLHRVWLHTRLDNLRAERLYRNLGFQLEGLERESILASQGYVSQHRWALLAQEWRP